MYIIVIINIIIQVVVVVVLGKQNKRIEECRRVFYKWDNERLDAIFTIYDLQF